VLNQKKIMPVHIKRIYEPWSFDDGCRVLVDRLWPRGIKKDTANIDEWLKGVAPSSALRTWFNHEPDKWKLFVEKYSAEIKDSPAFKELKSIIKKHKQVTLLYSAKDELHNQAVALLELLKQQ
jgi:uncharacterized protein YeaO (DUF488 family)